MEFELGCKRYEDYGTNRTCSFILKDIVNKGFSKGWRCRDLAVFNAVKDTLKKFNVFYVSDFEGRWELLPKEEEGI